MNKFNFKNLQFDQIGSNNSKAFDVNPEREKQCIKKKDVLIIELK